MSTNDPVGDGGGGGEGDGGGEQLTSTGTTSENVGESPSTPVPGTIATPVGQQQHQQYPPPSPLSGCYLLVVLPEPHTAQHKDLILNRLAKGFLSWDKDSCHVDLENELQALVTQAPEGEEARNGERLIQYATENLVTEVLIHPQTNTLLQCIRNLLASFTKHRHIIHAGYTFGGNGSWILQDGTFSLADFLDAFSEHEVQRVLRAYENSVTVDIHCAVVGDWTTSRLSKEACTRSCRVRVNPDDVLTAGETTIASFTSYIGQYLVPQTLDQLMEPSDVVGNIRFSHPTLYVFPGGQGDAALFGINGFNMLVDGGFARKSCFWDFTRHLDRLDAVLLTRINNSNIGGMSSVLRKKRDMYVYPQIGHFFCNLVERRQSNSPDGDKDMDPLILNLTDIGHEMMANLRHINLRAHPCYRDPEPINLYHKVGHGTLDMYVLSPSKDSREVREFLAKWHASDSKLFGGSHKKDNHLAFPIQNLVSICALLVWQPANPEDTITRILFPGSTPQHKIFEGFEKLKHLEFLKHPVCSAKSLSPSTSLTALKDKPAKKLFIDRETKKVEMKREKKESPDARTSKVADDTKTPPVIPTKPQAVKAESKSKKVIENKKIEENKKMEKEIKEKRDIKREKVERPEKHEKVEKPEKAEKVEKPEKKVERAEKKDDETKKVEKDSEKLPKEVIKLREIKKKESKEIKPATKPVKNELKPKPIEKKPKPQEKKEIIKSSPTTPKKTLNGTATKHEMAKTTSKPKAAVKNIAALPAKSAKDANNRKVLEQKNIEMADKEAKAPPKSKAVERKPISRRTKPGSPSKPRLPGSPAKSTRSTPTASVKSDKDGVVRKVKGDKGTTDSSAVSTPSGIEAETAKLVEKADKSEDVSLDSEAKVLVDLKEEREVAEEIEAVLKKGESEDLSMDSTESRVLADLKEEQEVAEEIEAVFKKAEEKADRSDAEQVKKDGMPIEPIESKVLADLKATEEMRKSVGSEDMSLDSIEVARIPTKPKVAEELAAALKKAEKFGERKDDRLEGDEDVTAEVTDKKEEDMTEEDITAEIEEEDEYLIVEKEEVYTESSVQSGEIEPKYVLDEAESEKAKALKDLEALKEVEKSKVDGKSEETLEKLSSEVKTEEEKEKDDKEVKAVAEVEILEEGMKEVAATTPEVVQKSEEKDDSGKKDSEDITKEPSSLSPDKIDSSEKKTSDTDLKHEVDKEQIPEKLEESQERISTLESGATTTAPTLPEDERIPLHEIKEDVNEKHAMEEVKEKDVPVEKKEEVNETPVPITAKPEIKVFDVRQTPQAFPRDIVKTPDEVADLPVHEEVDPHLYRMDDFGKDKESKEPPPTPPVKEQKGVFGFFGKVADKFEKGIDKLTKKRKDSDKDADDKSSSKSSSPKEPKPPEQAIPEDVDMDKVFPKVGKHEKHEAANKLEAAVTDSDVFLKMDKPTKADATEEVKPVVVDTDLFLKMEKSETPDIFEEAKPTMADVKTATIKETANFIQEEVSDSKRRSVDLGVKIADKVEEIIDTKFYDDRSPVKELSEEEVAEKGAVKDDLKEEGEDVEEVKALLEEASKKFKTVKDSLRDSLESLEDKIDVENLPEPLLKDTVTDTLEYVAEKLEEIKPQIESSLPDLKEVDKVKFDIPKDEEVEEAFGEEAEEEYTGPVRDIKGVFRDVGEVLAGVTGIDIEDTTLPTPPTSEPKEDDKNKKIILETMIPKKVGVTEEFPMHEEAQELYHSPPKSVRAFEKPEIQEDPCVKLSKQQQDIGSPIREAMQEREDAMKICTDILHEHDDEICSRKSSSARIDTSQFDVMVSGQEEVCVKKIQSGNNENIEEPEISYHKELPPVKAELVVVTPDSAPTSPKYTTEETYDKDLEENLREVLRQIDVPLDLKDVIEKPNELIEIIEELVISKKIKISNEIIEYITTVRRIPRAEVIMTIKDFLGQRKMTLENVAVSAEVLDREVPVTSPQRMEVENFINQEYVSKNRRVNIEEIDKIAYIKKVPRRIVIEIIEEIIVRRKILRHAILSASEEEEDKAGPVQADRVEDIKRKSIAASTSPSKESAPSLKEKESFEPKTELLKDREEVEPEVAEDVDEEKLVDGFVALPSKEELIHEERKMSLGRLEALKKDVDDFEAVEQEYKVQELTSKALLSPDRKEDVDETSDAVDAEKYGEEKQKLDKIEHELSQKEAIHPGENVKSAMELPELVSEISDVSETTEAVEKYLDEDKEKRVSKETEEEEKETITEAAKDEIRAVIAERRESFSRPSEDKKNDEEAIVKKDEKPEEQESVLLTDATERTKESQVDEEGLAKEKVPAKTTDQHSPRESSLFEHTEDTGTVRRMLVTASSEDGGQETEICASGTIHFVPTLDESGKDVAAKSVFEKDSLHSADSPEKDVISEKSTEVKDMGKATPDSLEKSPLAEREFRDLDDNLKKLEEKTSLDSGKPDDAVTNLEEEKRTTEDLIGEKSKIDDLNQATDASRSGSLVSEKGDRSRASSVSQDRIGKEKDAKSPSAEEILAQARSPSIQSGKFDEKELEILQDKSRASSISLDKGEKDSVDHTKSPSSIRSKSPSIAEEIEDFEVMHEKSRATSIVSDTLETKKMHEVQMDKSRSSSICEKQDGTRTPSPLGEKDDRSRSSSLIGDSPEYREVERILQKEIAENRASLRSTDVSLPMISGIFEEGRMHKSKSPSPILEMIEEKEQEDVLSRNEPIALLGTEAEKGVSDKSKSPSPVEKEKSNLTNELNDDKDAAKTPSGLSDKSDGERSIDGSKSPSIVEDKPDGYDRPVDKSRSASIASEAVGEIKSTVASRAPSIVESEKIDLKHPELPASKSRSASIASIHDDKAELKDVSHEITDISDSSSLTSVTQQTPGDRSKSPSITGDKADIEEIAEVPSKSRSASISIGEQKQPSGGPPKSPTAIEDKANTRENVETVIDKSRSTSVSSEVLKQELIENLPQVDKGEHLDRSKSPSTLSDKPDEKILADRSRSSSVTSDKDKEKPEESKAPPVVIDHNKPEIDRSRTSSVAGLDTAESSILAISASTNVELKKPEDKSKSPSPDRSRSPIIAEETMADVSRARSGSSASEKDTKDLPTPSKSPTGASEKSDKESTHTRSSSAGEAKAERERDMTDKSFALEEGISGKDEISKEYNVDYRSPPPSPVTEKSGSKSPSIAEEQGKSKYDASEKIADEIHLDKEVVRSRASSVASDKHSELATSDKGKSSSPVGGEQQRSRSQSIVSEKDESCHPHQIDDLKASKADSPMSTPKDRSRSHSLYETGEKTPSGRSRAGSLYEDKKPEKLVSHDLAEDTLQLEERVDFKDIDSKKSSFGGHERPESRKSITGEHEHTTHKEASSRKSSIGEHDRPESRKSITGDHETKESSSRRSSIAGHERPESRKSITGDHETKESSSRRSSIAGHERPESRKSVTGHHEDKHVKESSSRRSSIGGHERPESRRSITGEHEHTTHKEASSRKSSIGEHDRPESRRSITADHESREPGSRRSSIAGHERPESRKSVTGDHEHKPLKESSSRRSSIGIHERPESRKSIAGDHGTKESSSGRSSVEGHERPESRKSTAGDHEHMVPKESRSRKSSIGGHERPDSRKSITGDHEHAVPEKAGSRRSSVGGYERPESRLSISSDHEHTVPEKAASRKSIVGGHERAESRKSITADHEHAAPQEPRSRKSSITSHEKHESRKSIGGEHEHTVPEKPSSRKSSIGGHERPESRKSLSGDHEHVVPEEPRSRKSSVGGKEIPQSRKSIAEDYEYAIPTEEAFSRKSSTGGQDRSERRKSVLEEHEHTGLKESSSRKSSIGGHERPESRRSSHAALHEDIEDEYLIKITAEKKAEIEKYIVNDFIVKKRKITLGVIEEIVMIYSVPKFFVVDIIDNAIRARNIRRSSIIDFDDELEEGVLSPEKKMDVETYILEAFVSKSKKIMSKEFDEISKDMFVPRCILITIIEDIIVKRKLQSNEVIDNSLIDYYKKYPEPVHEGKRESPTGQGHPESPEKLRDEKEDSADGKISPSDFLKFEKDDTRKSPSLSPELIPSDKSTQDSPARSEPHIDEEISISEEKRTEVEKLLDEEYLKKGKRITEMLLEEIIIKTSLPRYIIIEIIEEIIMKRRLIREFIMDPEIYHNEDHEEYEDEKYVEKLSSEELGDIDSRKSSRASDYPEADDKQPEGSVHGYPMDYESQFHKAFVGGMTEIRTTHITTLSGKSTPDFIPREETTDAADARSMTGKSVLQHEPVETIRLIKETKISEIEATSSIEEEPETPGEGSEVVEEQKAKIVAITKEKVISSEDERKYESSEEAGKKITTADQVPEIVEITKTTKTIVTEQVPADLLDKSTEQSGTDVAQVLTISADEKESSSEIASAEVKTVVTKITTIAGSDGQIKTERDVKESHDTLEKDEAEKLLGSSYAIDKSEADTRIEEDDDALVKETVTTGESSDMKSFHESGRSTPDVKLTEKFDHPTSSVIKELISEERSFSDKSSVDISLPKDISPVKAPTHEFPCSPLAREGPGMHSHWSGRSTPDRRSEGRSSTATPEGFRSGEIIRTIITTTRTMSEEGDIITTTKEVTESTNEKGETVVLTEKTSSSVDSRPGSEQRMASSLGSDVPSEKDFGRASPSDQRSAQPSESTRSSRPNEVEEVAFSTAAMSSSFYGELPAVPPQLSTISTSESVPIQGDFTFKKFTVEKEFAGYEKESKKYHDEADLDFEKALMEHSQASSSFASDVSRYSNGSVREGNVDRAKAQDDDKEDRKDAKDPLEGWGSPLGLPSPKPPRKFNLKNPIASSSSTEFRGHTFDVMSDWGEPLRLPSPAPVANEVSNKASPSTPKKEKRPTKKVLSENIKNKKRSESPSRNEKRIKENKNKVQPVYMDLTYVPHHGNSYYTSLEFFKRVRARYYVFSGTEPSREVYDALLDAKKTWEDKDLEVTMIPTYDTDTLGYWVADNEEVLAANHIDLSPSASRCTINLQDHETSCSAYRLEF
ncbi:microtubule-associated protein futsch-like [Prorops nasuta]|uniref:microtubule-associated protein futsch-like n=1 Tax=Prorops nasuta TaxID=863751 RepID=UPI0034CEB65E